MTWKCALLKQIMTVINSTWVNFYWFPLMKRAFSSWIDFSRLSDLKKSINFRLISVNSNLMIIKNAPNEVYWTYSLIFVLEINAHNDQSCKTIESTLPFSAAGIKQNVLIVRPRRYISNHNKEKYIDRRSDFVTTRKKNPKRILKSWPSIIYLQLKFDDIQNNCLTKSGILCWSWVGKKIPIWDDWISSFILRECMIMNSHRWNWNK